MFNGHAQKNKSDRTHGASILWNKLKSQENCLDDRLLFRSYASVRALFKMPNSKQWRCSKPWLLPKGLFEISTSPVTPATAKNTPTNVFVSSSSSRNFPRYSHQIRRSKSFTPTLQTVHRPSTNDHGMKHTHWEKRSEEKTPSINNEGPRRAIKQANEQSHPAPWPMPPRRDYDLSDNAVTPTSPGAQRPPQNVVKPANQKIVAGPKVSEIARRLISEASSQENYQTPPESIVDDYETIEEDDSHSTESDLRVPRAVFDRIAKLYPPAPRAPTFPDFKDLFESEDNPTSSSYSITGENEQATTRSSSASESSASVVDFLQLFADSGDGEPTVIEEDGVLQPPSIDHVRAHRRQVPLPSGVGDKSFLNANGLRSLFDDKHIPASRTFSTLPPDSVTRARANALYVEKSSTKGGNFPRSRSDIPRASNRINSDASQSSLGRTKSIRKSNGVGDESEQKQKNRRKKKKRRDPSINRASIGGTSSEIQTEPNGLNADREDRKHPTTPPPLFNEKITASPLITDSISMNLSPSSAAAVSMPSSPGDPEPFVLAGIRKPDNLGLQRPGLGRQRTNVHPEAAGKNRVGENENGNNKVGMVGRGTGIFIRENVRRPAMEGIVRAETGWIAGPGDLNGDGPPTTVQDNPNPKSLATFNADDATTQSSMFPTMRMGDEFEDANSGSDSSILEEPLSRSLVNLSMQVRGGSHASSSDGVYCANTGSSEQERNDGRGAPVVEDASFKLVERLRRAAGALGVRKRAGDTVDMGTSDLTMTGTLDEAMVRVCYVCRKVLDFRVDVRDGGRKIRIESKDAPSTKMCLRVTLSLTEVGDVDKRCTLKVLQSRGDANRTSIVTLWDFYRKLEKHLRKVEETGVLPDKPAGSSKASGRSASTTNVRGSTSTSAGAKDRVKHGRTINSSNSRHSGNG